MIFKIGALRKFPKLTGKRLCRSHFFNKVAEQPRTTLTASSVSTEKNSTKLNFLF